MTTSPTPDRPLRADAERNRQRILTAAAEVFAERGLDVSLDDIAAAAGVGVGTVYRRFPDKDALIDALFDSKIAEVEQVLHDALAIEDPWDSFEAFVRGMCALQAADRGLKEILHSTDRGRERVGQGKVRIAPLASKIVARARDAGVVRADLDSFDVPMAHFAIGYVAERTRDVAPDYWQRAVTIWLDGVRARPDGQLPMPAPALDPESFQSALSRRRC
jgi:AcrR family transcriptional regulator